MKQPKLSMNLKKSPKKAAANPEKVAKAVGLKNYGKKQMQRLAKAGK